MNLDEHDHGRTVAGVALAFSIILLGGYIKDHPEYFRNGPEPFTQGKHNQSEPMF
ncbi:MAG: hypothetical protein PHH16_05305 [Candidatus Gracilibacteria bacterium]|nr:hypothetical protein [Candidatus Gracilibacteria bacterium]